VLIILGTFAEFDEIIMRGPRRQEEGSNLAVAREPLTRDRPYAMKAPGMIREKLWAKLWALPLPAPVVQVVRGLGNRRVASLAMFRAEVENKLGLEIGGPSGIFQDAGELPIYRYMAGLDNCVFSGETIWEGRREQGRTFFYHPRKGKGFNFIREATDLHDIPNHGYDFVLSSHSLEHTANPIQALKEWMRIVKPRGAIVVVVPDYRYTFDHRRRPTPVEHMLDDYNRGTDEKDTTHLSEILKLHNLALDPAAGSLDNFRNRSLRNFENRCLHHHVFDPGNSRRLFEASGLTVEVQEIVKPHNIVLLARCP
jgi:SAM-dependent methyltransferase